PLQAGHQEFLMRPGPGPGPPGEPVHGLGVSLTKLPGAAIGGISPGQRAADAAHGTPDKAQRRK
ncbi:MAG: hypothetical protein ACRDRQ_14270, partial [Pseudonocardiaceae bacterium]